MTIVTKPLLPEEGEQIQFVGKSFHKSYRNGQNWDFAQYDLITLKLRKQSHELEIYLKNKLIAEDFGPFVFVYPECSSSVCEVMWPSNFAVVQMPNNVKLGIDTAHKDLPTRLPYNQWTVWLNQDHRGWIWLLLYKVARKYPNEIWQNKLQFVYNGTVGEIFLNLRKIKTLYRKGIRPLLDNLNDLVEQELKYRRLL